MDRQYRITGQWIPADNTDNHLEFAVTEEPGVRAMRSTYQPDNILFTTARQLREALRALETRPEFRELVSS